MALTPVILAGGGGTRLWPLSRAAHPKPFLKLFGEETLFAMTLARCAGLGRPPLVVCNEAHADLVRAEAGGTVSLLLEPCGRNSAPAIAVAAWQAMESDPEAALLVLPADHLVAPLDAFHALVRAALPYAAAGRLVTFGIAPNRAETAYGYIRPGTALDAGPGRRIARFIEKPDAETAQALLAEGACLWNSGMFLLRAGTYLEELARHRPDIAAAAEAAWRGREALEGGWRLDEEAFAACPAESIDYAVMQPTGKGAVLAAKLDWSDIGSWDALVAAGAEAGDRLALDVEGSHFFSDGPLIAAIGVKDLIVVATGDAVLVVDKTRAQAVRQLIERLKAEGRTDLL